MICTFVVVSTKAVVEIMKERGMKFASYADFSFVFSFIVFAPIGTVFLLVRNRKDYQTSHWQVIKRGWRDCKHDWRKWRYRKFNGQPALQWLARMRKRKNKSA